MPEESFAYITETLEITDLADDILLVDCSGGSVTVTIPAGEEVNGRTIQVKKVAGTVLQLCTITPASGQIDGGGSVTLLTGTAARFGRGPTESTLNPANYTWIRL